MRDPGFGHKLCLFTSTPPYFLFPFPLASPPAIYPGDFTGLLSEIAQSKPLFSQRRIFLQIEIDAMRAIWIRFSPHRRRWSSSIKPKEQKLSSMKEKTRIYWAKWRDFRRIFLHSLLIL